ncbi:AAA family ATPase [Streptacidiphilus sp. ASG 303]|uniref:AAA family ATPase n=1 Tax=Streptacidiphilus sp. ASG 303 TaxID=2896847 RepID=UPI001E5DE7BC|nr:adenylate/guanylate cyclase domain-containing protein [Streptacidiphilus sp. ASG 303]MCD0484754.1 AAA family ATPase [Streptacidiphilus sp. ASG 303]
MSVVFIDLVSSTALAGSLDPEALRVTMDRYYTACTTAVADHGGVVEKFIGDAVMAVFGAFRSHEDDALRAVRAACALVDALEGLNADLERGFGLRLDVHSGIATGEAVVVGDAGGGARVVGDVVHTAARLQSHAAAHEILIDDDTARLVGAWVRLEGLAPLSLKGKPGPVTAWRAVEVLPGPAREDTVALIGREAELEQLRRAYARVRRDRTCALVTVVGTAGIGKSRLLREFLANPAAAGASVLRGTCRAYGAGLTYWPVADAVWSLPGGWEEAAGVLTADRPDGRRAVDALAAALDLATGAGRPVSVAEIAWAFRCLVEALGRRGPLIVVLEDFHWAEPTLLDLVQDVAEGVTDAEVLLLCAARPDMPGSRSAWAGGSGHAAAVVELGPLTDGQTRELVRLTAERAEVSAQSMTLTDEALDRIVGECDGNPLFAELLLERPVGDVPAPGLPASIRVLLAAWLDRLPATDREVLERAAAVGCDFTAEDVRVLAGDAPALAGDVLDASLRRLLRSRAVHPSGPPGAYRFSRPLARDTVYEMTSKARRATWHTLLADRLADRAGGGRHAGTAGSAGSAADGDLAHHLESACRLLGEVHPGDPRLPDLTGRAAHALVSTGYRALRRRDLPAAVSLLERGRDLVAPGDPEHRVLAIRISDAHAGLGLWDRARAAVGEAERRSAGDPRTRRTCTIQRQLVDLRSGLPVPPPDALARDVRSDPDDDLSWCRFHQLASLRSFADGRIGAAESAVRDALLRARAAGDGYEEDRLLASVCELTQWSPTPVSEGIALCGELAARFDTDRSLLVPVLLTRARLQALAGLLGEARDGLEQARRHAADLQLTLGAVAADQAAGLVASLSGDHADALRHYGTAADRLHGLGRGTTAATLRIYAARELLRAGDTASCAAALRALDPARLETRGRLVLLALRARLGATGAWPGDPVAAAEEAAALLGSTDDPVLTGDVRFETARALDACGMRDRARLAAREALASFTAKGAELPCRDVRSWLAARGGTP